MTSCACQPDFIVVGMQDGEEVATALRLVGLVISLSIVFPWLDNKRRHSMHLFCLHWSSGTIYVLSQFVMSVIVLLCWSTNDAKAFIYFLKFVELASLNVWCISSVAIGLLIVNIVKAFDKCRRVPSVIGSKKVLGGVILVSLLLTLSSIVFWTDLLVTGAYMWVTDAHDENIAHWITLSFAIVQLVAGVIMLALLIYITTPPRLGILRICCNTSKRVQYYVLLTIMGTVIYVYSGMALLYDEFSFAIITKKLVMIGWCFKYLHVIFDTLILMGALWAQQRHEQENLPSFSVAKSGSGDARSICDCNRSLASAGAVSEGSRRAVTPTENSGDTHQKSHLRPEDISNIDISDDKGASSRSSVTGMERAGAGAPSEVQYPSVVSGVSSNPLHNREIATGDE